MTKRPIARLALAAAAVAAGLCTVPAAAVAAPAPDPAKLVGVTELDPATGRGKTYFIGRGEVAPNAIGVTNVGDAPVQGVVVQIRVLDDLDFAKKYQNCWYAVDSNLDAAWCSFDGELAAGSTLALAGPMVSTTTNARPDKVGAIVFSWYSKEWADAQGGLEALAGNDAGQNNRPVQGTEGVLTLESRSLPLPERTGNPQFTYVGLTVAPTTSPTASPSASPPTGQPSASATPPATGEGGGMPVTGTQAATVGGIGGALLLVGAVSYLVARRRRTRFVA